MNRKQKSILAGRKPKPAPRKEEHEWDSSVILIAWNEWYKSLLLQEAIVRQFVLQSVRVPEDMLRGER